MNRNIAFVTSAQWPDLTDDDRLAVVEIERRGGRVTSAVWTEAVDWSSFDAVVLRSCWDYHRRVDEFSAWLARMRADGVPLMNAADTVEWNLDKHYLLELAGSGARVIETRIPERGERLRDIMRERGWSRAVVKPRVSADGFRTILVDDDNADAHQADLDDLAAGRGALVQPFLQEVVSDGELSFIFIGGDYSHCVRKRPAPSEFRVQNTFGGTAEAHDADARLIAQAELVLNPAARPTDYARVDGCIVDGELHLMELELIEPTLFLSLDARAPARLAEHVMNPGRARSTRRTA